MPPAPELDAARRRLERVRREVAAVLAACRGPVLNERPAERSWSVGECALHVLETNGGFLERAEKVIEREKARGRSAAGPFRYGALARWFLAQIEPGSRNLPAPRAFRPRQREAGAGVADEMDASLARLDRALAGAVGLDLARARVTSPAMPLLRLPLGIALPMLVAHTERHLRQMERCMAAIALGNAASA